LANFLLPSVLVVSFVAVTVAIREKLGKSFRSTIAAALSIGLVAVIVGPITGFLAGLAIGVGL